MSAGFPGGNQMAKPGGAEFNEPVGDFYGGMTPGDALGGGLTQIDPLTGLPRGQTAQAPGNYPGRNFGPGDLSTPFMGRPAPQGPLPGDMLGTPVDTPRVNYPGQTFGPRDLSTPGPQPQPQQFPNLMQNPAFNPGIQPPQQMQQIAQGQPTLVNQLSPPPAAGPVPGQSITQQPQPFPQPPQVNMDFLRQPGTTPPPQVQAPFSPPPRVNMDFLRQPGTTPPAAAPAPFSPPPRVNMDFLRQPVAAPVAQPMPTRATQGYQSRIAQPAPRPQPVIQRPAPRPAPAPVRAAPAPAPRPAPKPAPVKRVPAKSSIARLGR